MRLDRLRVRGMGVLRDVDLDLSALPGPIVAVTGPNGSGKTSLLEAFPAALYRKTPSRGGLAELARDRGSFVEATITNGATYTLRHTIDALNKKGESVVLDASGVPVIASARRLDFDAWAAEHLPSAQVFFSSVFGAQGAGGFLNLDPGERKGVVLRILGVDHLETLADLARERARTARAVSDATEQRVHDEQARAEDPDALANGLAVARAGAVEAREQADQTAAAERLARDTDAAWRAEQEARDAALKALSRLDADRARLTAALADHDGRIANNRRALAERDGILAAEASLEGLRMKVRELQADAARAIDAERAAASEAARLDAESRSAMESGRSWERRAGDARATLRDRERVAHAAAQLDRLQGEVDAAERERAAAEVAVEELGRVALAGADDRVRTLRGGLETIAGAAAGGQDIARTTLADDDRAVRAVAAHPRRVAEARARLVRAREAAASAAKRLAADRQTAARADAIAAAEQTLATAVEEAARWVAQAEDLRARAQARRAEATENGAPDTSTLRDARDVVAAAEKRAVLAPRVREAEERIRDLERSRAERAGELAGVEARIAEARPPPPALSRPDVAGPARVAQDAAAAARAADAEVVRLEGRLAAARDAAKRLAALRGEVEGRAEELADWTKLAQDLGRDGLQAAEIDAAIPELTELANDLLHRCVSTRWTVSVETTYRDSTGKRTLESLLVLVTDAETGFHGDAKRLSGGERVLVGEALSLALTMMAMRRAGLRGATIVRDETASALDEEKARAWVAMLRRAAEIVGAHRVLYVSHTPDTWDLADARIIVRDGTVTIA